MQIEYVLATNSVQASAKSCWSGKDVEGMKRVSWKGYWIPGCSVKLRLQDWGMNWPRYDTILSPDNRNMNLTEMCVDDVNVDHVASRDVSARLDREA